MRLKLSLITCLAIVISACSAIKKNTSSYTDAHVNNIAWAVISFKGKTLNNGDFPNGMPTFIFNMQDGKIVGNDGCNNFMGLATYTSTTIKPGPIASTKNACANTAFNNDFYEVLLSDKITYRLNNDILRLYVNDAEVMALKEKQ